MLIVVCAGLILLSSEVQKARVIALMIGGHEKLPSREDHIEMAVEVNVLPDAECIDAP